MACIMPFYLEDLSICRESWRTTTEQLGFGGVKYIPYEQLREEGRSLNLVIYSLDNLSHYVGVSICEHTLKWTMIHSPTQHVTETQP